MGTQTRSLQRASTARQVRVLDLFSGAGGLSEGLKQASDRFKTLRAIESDKSAAATCAQNHGDEVVFAGKIEDWLKTEAVPEADLIIGGPPCQGFSALGKRDVLDDRNQLWLRYAETIRKARPQFFILENVPAFLDSEQSKRFKRQCQPSGPLGEYKFQARVLNAAGYGAAQVRRRVILIGHRRDREFPGFPSPTHTPNNYRRVKDVLHGLTEEVTTTDLPNHRTGFRGEELPGVFRTSDLHLTRYYEPRSLLRFGHIPPGGNRFDIPDDLLSPCWRNYQTGSADVMGRLSWEQPSVTIRTEFFKPEKGRYLHPTENRAITHHEAARIQGFPDHYKWVGSKTSIARQIGNAVPIPLAKAIGEHLVNLF